VNSSRISAAPGGGEKKKTTGDASAPQRAYKQVAGLGSAPKKKRGGAPPKKPNPPPHRLLGGHPRAGCSTSKRSAKARRGEGSAAADVPIRVSVPRAASGLGRKRGRGAKGRPWGGLGAAPSGFQARHARKSGRAGALLRSSNDGPQPRSASASLLKAVGARFGALQPYVGPGTSCPRGKCFSRFSERKLEPRREGSAG